MLKTPKLRFKDKNGNAYPEWKEKKIGDIATLTSSKRIHASDYVPKGIPFYRGKEITELKTNKKISDLLYISEDIYDEYKMKYGAPQKNDILVTAVGTLGNVWAVDNEYPFYFKDGNLIWFKHVKENSKFIEYLLLSPKGKKKLLNSAIGSNQKALTIVGINKLYFKFPCLEEQEKIAGFLSKVDELINECEGEVKDLEEQKKGLMQKIFSQQIRFKDSNNNPYPDWEEHCINEFIISLKSGLSRELQNEDIGIPVIRANNTYNGIVGGNDIKYWYKKDPKGANIDNYILDDGDILINFINSLPRMGETAIYTNFLNRPCIYTTNLLRLKLNNKLNYKYFFYYTKTSEYINYIKAITKPAVNQASFTTVDFKNLKLLLPCLEEQEKIAKVLSKMNELIEEKKALLSDWQQFKKGLLQQMFV